MEESNEKVMEMNKEAGEEIRNEPGGARKMGFKRKVWGKLTKREFEQCRGEYTGGSGCVGWSLAQGPFLCACKVMDLSWYPDYWPTCSRCVIVSISPSSYSTSVSPPPLTPAS